MKLNMKNLPLLLVILIGSSNVFAIDMGFSSPQDSENKSLESTALTSDTETKTGAGKELTDKQIGEGRQNTPIRIAHRSAEQTMDLRLEKWLDSAEGKPFKRQIALGRINIYKGVAVNPTSGVSMQDMQWAFEAALGNALANAAESQILEATGEMVKKLVVQDPEFSQDICSLDQELNQSDLIVRKSMNLATTAVSEIVKKETGASDKQIKEDIKPIKHSVTKTSIENSIRRMINEGTGKAVEVDGLFVLRTFTDVTDQGVIVNGVLMVEHSLTTALIRTAKNSKGDFDPNDYEIPNAFPKIDEMTDSDGNNLGLYTIKDFVKYISKDVSNTPFGAQLIRDIHGQLTFVSIGYDAVRTTDSASRMSVYTKAAKKRAKSLANIQMQYLSNLLVTTTVEIDDMSAYIEEMTQAYTDCTATGYAEPNTNSPVSSNNISSRSEFKTSGASIGTKRDVIVYTNPYLPDQETWLGFAYWSPSLEKKVHSMQQSKKDAIKLNAPKKSISNPNHSMSSTESITIISADF